MNKYAVRHAMFTPCPKLHKLMFRKYAEIVLSGLSLDTSVLDDQISPALQ